MLELRLIAKNCGFGNLEDQLIRDRIVCGTCSEDVRQRLLRVDDLTLEKATSICRTDAESKKSSQYIAETSAEVFGLKQKYNNRHNTQSRVTRKPPEELTQRKRTCGNCGLAHPRKQCPAYGKQCLKCNKFNHFAKLCRSASRKTDAIEQAEWCEDHSDSDDGESLFIDAIKNDTEISNNDCYTTLPVEGTPIKFKVDTGSQVNILPVSVYHKLTTQSPLKRCNTKLTSYSGGNLKVLGRSHLSCRQKKLLFYVVDTTQDPILGLSASQELGIIKIVLNIMQGSASDQLITMYPKLFKGLGCLKAPYHIQTDPSVIPVITLCRNHPVAIRDRLKQKQNEMEAMGVIRKVDQPTDWVNSLIVIEKPNLHVCLDPRPLNNAIR